MAMSTTLPTPPPTTTEPSSQHPHTPPGQHRPLPRCAVVNFSREGDSVRWAPRLASSHDRVCAGLVVRGNANGRVGVVNGNDRMRALLEDPFRLEELSSRALKFMKKSGKKSTWGVGYSEGGNVIEKGKRSPTKISETGLDCLEEENENKEGGNTNDGVGVVRSEDERKGVANSRKKGKMDFSHLQAISPRKSSNVLKRRKGSNGESEEPSLFARMFAKAKRKSGAKRDDVFDDEDLKDLKARLQRPSRAGTRMSSASKGKSRRASKATAKESVLSSKEKAMILHPTANRSRRRWFLRSSRTPKNKQLIVYQNSYRVHDSNRKHGLRLRRLPRLFKKRRSRFADQHQGASEHNTSRRLIPNVSMYNDDFVAFMTSAAVKKGSQM